MWRCSDVASSGIFWELLWDCGWNCWEPNGSGKFSPPKLWKILSWEASLTVGHTPWKATYFSISSWVSTWHLESNKFKIKLVISSAPTGSLRAFQILVNGNPTPLITWSDLWIFSNIHTSLPIISKSLWLYLQTMSEIWPLPLSFPDPSHYSLT